MDSQTSAENLATTITAPPPAAGEKTDELDLLDAGFNTPIAALLSPHSPPADPCVYPRGWENLVLDGVGCEDEIAEWIRTERAVRFWHRLARAQRRQRREQVAGRAPKPH